VAVINIDDTWSK